jgi:hypothetical protein
MRLAELGDPPQDCHARRHVLIHWLMAICGKCRLPLFGDDNDCFVHSAKHRTSENFENPLSASCQEIPYLGRDKTVDAAAKRKVGEAFSQFWPLRQGDEAGSVVPGIALPIQPITTADINFLGGFYHGVRCIS